MSADMGAQLAGLSTWEAIQDAIYRAVSGLDLPDRALFQSAFVSSSIFDMDGLVLNGLEDIEKRCYDRVAELITTHLVTNIRIELTSDSTAIATASAVAQHYWPNKGFSNEPGYLAGGRYRLDLIKHEDSSWRIKRWEMKRSWGAGDISIVAPRDD